MCKVNRKEMFKEAHKMTRNLIAEFPNIKYHDQLGLCLKQLWKESKTPVETPQLAAEEPAKYNTIITETKNSGTQELHIDCYNTDVKVQAILHYKKQRDTVTAQIKCEFFKHFMEQDTVKCVWNYKKGTFKYVDSGKEVMECDVEEIIHRAITKAFFNIGIAFDEDKCVFLINKPAEEPKTNKPVKQEEQEEAPKQEEQPKKENKKEGGKVGIENNVKYISLPEDGGVQCNVFENGYVRGRIDENWFFWRNGNAKIVIVDKPYVKGNPIGFMEPYRVIERIKNAGYSSVAAAIKEAHYKELPVAENTQGEYRKAF